MDEGTRMIGDLLNGIDYRTKSARETLGWS
jgi:hypothetical protein